MRLGLNQSKDWRRQQKGHEQDLTLQRARPVTTSDHNPSTCLSLNRLCNYTPTHASTVDNSSHHLNAGMRCAQNKWTPHQPPSNPAGKLASARATLHRKRETRRLCFPNQCIDEAAEILQVAGLTSNMRGVIIMYEVGEYCRMA